MASRILTRERLARVLVWSFILVLVPWGVLGMLAPRFWYERVFGIDLASLGAARTAAVLSEFRFLQARELGVGLTALVLRKDILRSRRMGVLFAVLVALAPAARVIGFFSDGLPAMPIAGFALTELLFLVVLLVLAPWKLAPEP
jgi:hypothetical protein